MFVPGGAIRPIDFAGLRIFDYTAGHDLAPAFCLCGDMDSSVRCGVVVRLYGGTNNQ